MPRSNITAAMIAEMKKQGALDLVTLLDIQTIDGTNYFLCDTEGTYPTRILSLLDPSAFNTANWTKSVPPTVTVTANAVAAPDGTVTADQLDFAATGVGQFAMISQQRTTNVAALRFTFTVWLRANAATSVTLSVRPQPITVQQDTAMNVNTAWQPFSVSVFVPAGTTANTIEVAIYSAPSQTARTVFAWGASLSIDYYPWLKSAGPFRRSRDSRTDAGDIVLENLSGNSIDREVQRSIGIHEYEGAFAVLRFWHPLLLDIADEFHGYLSEQSAPEDEYSFRMLQLFDPAQYDTAPFIIADRCDLRFKSVECGSAGAATVCNKLFSTCSDGTHSASERFHGVLSMTPGPLIFPGSVDTGAGPRGSDWGDDDRRGGRGRLLQIL
jgi:hypothetical protein